jgi:hypothetical protein
MRTFRVQKGSYEQRALSLSFAAFKIIRLTQDIHDDRAVELRGLFACSCSSEQNLHIRVRRDQSVALKPQILRGGDSLNVRKAHLAARQVPALEKYSFGAHCTQFARGT